MVANSLNSSTEKTFKVSFKAAGTKYREHFTVAEVLLQDVSSEERHRTYSSTSTRSSTGQKTTKESLEVETRQVKNSTNVTMTLADVGKQPVLDENKGINSDLQVLSSFDCVKSIPTVLIDYISNMFLYEYGRSHKDFHSQQRIAESLPLLKQFNINCGTNQNCSTLFQYDKQYGLNTTGDSTYARKGVFYCCPSVNSSTNKTISKVCERAQTISGKSVLRESKESTFLGWVIQLITNLILNFFCLTL